MLNSFLFKPAFFSGIRKILHAFLKGLVILAAFSLAFLMFFAIGKIFSKSLLLGILFVFFIIPLLARLFFVCLAMSLPFIFSSVFSAADPDKKRHSSAIDVPFKILE